MPMVTSITTSILVVWPYLLTVTVVVCAVCAAVHAAMYKRDPRAAAGWVGVIIVFPIAGTLLYYFLGITNDGLYYVEATLPINAPFLIADGNINSTLPVDGIPFTASIPYNWDELHQYYQTVTDKLNATDDFNFTPYLPQLDFMMESLTINGL